MDVGITKSLAPVVGDVRRTSPLTFTMTASNTGPNRATSVQFVDPLPPGLQFVTATPSPGTTYDVATGIWDVGTIEVGAQPTLSIVVVVTGGPGDYTNAISLTRVDQTDSNDQNNTASVSWTVRAEADLAVTKTVVPDVAGPGDTVTYTVTVTNNGPEDDTGVQLVETNRTPATFTSIVATKGSFDPDSRVWTIGALANGESATITVQVLITTPAVVVNHTVVFTADLPDPDLTNNEATATLTVPGADLAVTKTVDNPAPAIGAPVTFTIGLRNNGPDSALGTTVADPVPAGLTFGSAVPSTGTYDATTGVWTVGAVLPGDTATLTIMATPTVAGTFVNTATAAASSPPDFDPSNNTATATVTVPGAPVPPEPPQPPGGSADVSITKTASATNVLVGATVTFTITVTSHGPATATGVVVTDQLPAGLAPASADPRCTLSAATVTCALGSLAPGATTSIDVVTTVQAAGALVNTAVVEAVEVDPTVSDNQAQAVVMAVTGELPASGSDPGGLLRSGAALLGLGGVLTALSWRRRRLL